MKFLVINRHTGAQHKAKGGPAALREHAKAVKALIANGTLSGAWAFAEGGHAYILNATDTKDLFVKVRQNPLFGTSETEVIPCVDAVDFLEHAATHFEKK